ncbi:MAG: large-conductance mechanosensitive channel protein MscL [Candidatus Atribacteria bacterium]|nr:large-conductance mechanosensitive channel protein MscL [Candidatus Atribacteria bacterium]
MSKLIDEFKEFISRGNVVDLAVGFIIGTAFGAIVKSLVSDIIMPPIGLALGKVDFSNLFVVLKEGDTPGPYYTVASAQEAGAVTLNYGLFINSIITFLIIALAVFMIVKVINNMQRKKEAPPAAPTTKECPFCFTAIPIKAVRCPNCTSELTKA